MLSCHGVNSPAASDHPMTPLFRKAVNVAHHDVALGDVLSAIVPDVSQREPNRDVGISNTTLDVSVTEGLLLLHAIQWEVADAITALIGTYPDLRDTIVGVFKELDTSASHISHRPLQSTRNVKQDIALLRSPVAHRRRDAREELLQRPGTTLVDDLRELDIGTPVGVQLDVSRRDDGILGVSGPRLTRMRRNEKIGQVDHPSGLPVPHDIFIAEVDIGIGERQVSLLAEPNLPSIDEDTGAEPGRPHGRV